MKLIQVPFTELKFIAHISDIHIRLFKRHAEYKQVFEKLYTNIRTTLPDNNSVIVVAGDIVHAKTDMSPEMVDMASEFLDSLANIAPTLVVAGNHDMNVANQNRLDALSPIISNLKNKNLHYLKDSGIYTVANTDFAMMSIVGSREDWPDAFECLSKKKVALFHGPVYGATTDVGYTITNKHAPLSMFNNFDLALLGDIHKYQILQTRTSLDDWPCSMKAELEKECIKIPTIAYAGSLIQQNHGETLKNHGWLLWSLDDFSHKFIEAENSHGYYTLSLQDKYTVPNISDMPENVRLRVLVGDVTQNIVKKAIAIIRKKYNVAEISISRLGGPHMTSSGASSMSSNFDVHDISFQNELITDYINNNFPNTSEDILTQVLQINASLNEKIVDDDLPRNVSWKPITLKFDNLFSYGTGNFIDFENLHGIVGVFAPNASGKTSAFDALCFALYDKTPRAFKGSHIMNTRKDECSCELRFAVGDNEYIIERIGSRRKNGEVKVDVLFFQIDKNGNQISLNGDDRRDTNSVIRSFVGDYEDFILTTLSVQNQNSLFIDKGQSDRKDLLSQFMGLTIFDKLYNLASDDSKEVVGALKQFKKDDFTQKLADIQLDINKKVPILQDKIEKLAHYKNKVNEIQEKIKKLHEQLSPVDSNLNISKIESQLENLRNRIELFEKEISIEIEKSSNLEKQVNKIQFSVKNEIYSSIEDRYKAFTKLKMGEPVILSQLKYCDKELADLNKNLERLKSNKYNPNCDICVDREQNTIFELGDIQTKIKAKSQERSAIIQEQSSLTEKITELGNMEETYFKYQDLVKTGISLQQKWSNSKLNVLSKESDLKDLKNNLERVEEMKDEYNRIIDVIRQNQKINGEIVEEQKVLSTAKKLVEKLEPEFTGLHSEIEVLKSKKNELMNQFKEAEELEAKFEAYELYINAVSRDGISYRLISETIPTIQSEVNNILAQVAEFSVLMELDGKNINGKIMYDNDRIWPLELASGMEKFITSLAIRVALMHVSNLPKSNFLILDEGLSVLDSDNLPSMSMIFDLLKTKFEFIILISHLDQVRDVADSLIEIQRDDGYSHIEVM